LAVKNKNKDFSLRIHAQIFLNSLAILLKGLKKKGEHKAIFI
jgi:hypothetical protein